MTLPVTIWLVYRDEAHYLAAVAEVGAWHAQELEIDWRTAMQRGMRQRALCVLHHDTAPDLEGPRYVVSLQRASDAAYHHRGPTVTSRAGAAGAP